MKKFEKNIIVVSLISLGVAVMFNIITSIVAVNSTIKFLKVEGVNTVFDLMEYGTKRLDELTESGKIVVNDDDDHDHVIVDFSEGIHVETDNETVIIDRNGINVTEK